MASADHSQFKFAAERYILDELPEAEREAFEEHYFACETCSQDVEHLTNLRLAAPLVLPRLDRGAPDKQPLSWFARPWVPQFALSALAILVLITGYQNSVLIPRLRAESDDLLQLMAAPKPLIAQRGAGTLRIPGLPRMAPLLIKDEWPVSYSRYTARVTRRGATEALLRAEAQVARGSLLITIPARKLGVGTFDLTISGQDSGGVAEDVARYPFTIQGE